ncbi:MAG: hypothetical protein HY801_14820 [Candidatus Lindowbacteria bacterium]|nr:hypothetical protein [Candidatus Lindowbacteria bacterium]
MLTSVALFKGVNLILAVVCLLSIFLVFKFVPNKRARNLLIVAFVLIIFANGVFWFCMKVWKLYEIASGGELLGKAPPGTANKVIFIRNMAQLGNVFEAVAAILFVLVSKTFISRASGKTGGEA